MNKETDLKHLLDAVGKEASFSGLEYEALFRRVEQGVEMEEELRLYFNGVRILTVGKEELNKNPEEPVLETLIRKLYEVLQVDVLDLQKAKRRLLELQKELRLKKERRERQYASPFKREKLLKSIEKEVEALEKKRDEQGRKINQLYKSSEYLQMVRAFEERLESQPE